MNFETFPNFGKFQTSKKKNFQRFFLTKMFFLTIFSSNNFSLLSRPLHCIKGICMYLLKFHCKNPEMYKFHCFQDHYTLIKSYVQKNCQKKFRMAKNGHSKFFFTIFPKNTGINLEQPKIAIPNFFQKFFPKRLV